MKIRVLLATVLLWSISGIMLSPDARMATAALADEMPLARQIAEKMVSEEAYAALMAASAQEIRLQTRSKLDAYTDTSKLSDRDLDTMLKLAAEATNKGVVAGLRKAFEKELAKLAEPDLKILFACVNGRPCKTASMSADGIAIVKKLPAVGRETGQRIGQILGTAATPNLIKKIQGMDASDFDDRNELLRIMQFDPWNTVATEKS